MNNPAKSGFFKSLFGQGRQTPARDEIRLYIPISSRAEMGENLNIEAMWNQVMQKRLGPLQLLQEANRYLEKINPLPLTYAQRTRLSNILLNEVVNAVSGLFAHFFKQGGGIPETREQRETISQGVRAAEQLTTSYKLLFRHDWADPDQSRQAHEKTTLVVLRIFECARLEQLLLAFRYQKLPQHTWRDVNQLFFALREVWDISTKFPLKVQWLVEDGVYRVEMFPKTANLEQLYLSIQLTGLLDVISWPVHLAYRVGSYISAIEGILVEDDDKGEDIPDGYSIIYRNHGGPPSFNRSQNNTGETLLIYLKPVIQMVTQDQAALASAEGAPAPSKALLEILPERDRVSFLDLMLPRLQPHERLDARHRVFDGRHARVYGGFEAVHRLFRDIGRKDKDQKDVAEERRFWDSLAEHTSIVSESEDTLLEPRWLVANEGAGGIQLNLQEGEYGAPVYVGRIVAYNTSEEALANSRLGYVVRLHRLGDDEVEVAIARLREEIQPVMAEDPDAGEERHFPALLIRNKDGKSQLLCDNKHKAATGDRLVIVHGDQRQTSAVGDAILVQGDYTVFDLHTPE